MTTPEWKFDSKVLKDAATQALEDTRWKVDALSKGSATSMTTPEDESASPRIEPPAEAVEVVARAIYDAPGPDGDHLAAYFSDNFRISATNVVELRAEILNICRCAAREAIEAYEAWRRSPDTRGEKHMTTPEEAARERDCKSAALFLDLHEKAVELAEAHNGEEWARVSADVRSAAIASCAIFAGALLRAHTALLAAEARIRVLEEALRNSEAFIGVMFGHGPDAEIDETVASPIGVPIKLGDIMRSIRAALAKPEETP